MKTIKNQRFFHPSFFPKTRKSQMKIQQTAFMLIAVTLLFVLVGLFFLSVRLSELKRGASELEEKNAKLLITRLADSPEFNCDSSNLRVGCVDADKVMTLKERINEYANFWGVSGIEIRKIYPKSSQDIKCTLSNYPNCNIIEVKKGQGTFVGNFVSLCRKEVYEGDVYDKCEIALLQVSYEAKT